MSFFVLYPAVFFVFFLACLISFSLLLPFSLALLLRLFSTVGIRCRVENALVGNFYGFFFFGGPFVVLFAVSTLRNGYIQRICDVCGNLCLGLGLSLCLSPEALLTCENATLSSFLSVFK